MAHKTPPLQLAFRTAIMLGTLVVGSMTAFLYGPPPEQLAGYANWAAVRWNELTGQISMPESMEELADFSAFESEDSSELLPIESGDSMVEPAAFFSEVSQPEAQSTADWENQIKLAGAEQAKVESWGSTGQVYRAWAVVPESGMQKHYGAMASSAQEAAAQVIAQINQSDLK